LGAGEVAACLADQEPISAKNSSGSKYDRLSSTAGRSKRTDKSEKKNSAMGISEEAEGCTRMKCSRHFCITSQGRDGEWMEIDGDGETHRDRAEAVWRQKNNKRDEP
jgi:hypothetical protein